MDCIFIGNNFYYESGTMMSSVYEIKKVRQYTRTDWGQISILLEAGNSVHIRPANKEEMEMFTEKLRQLKERDKEDAKA